VVSCNRSSPCSGYSAARINPLWPCAAQVFPLLQIAVGRRDSDQFAVDAARHRFAVHVADVATEQACGAGGGLVLPVPVADIEGSF